MSAGKATKPAAEISARGPREIRSALAGKICLNAIQPQAKNQDGKRVSLLPMQAAFLAGLLDLAQRETSDESIALPSGPVDPIELRQVIIALLRARGGETRP
jgi:hypothetical protein